MYIALNILVLVILVLQLELQITVQLIFILSFSSIIQILFLCFIWITKNVLIVFSFS